MKYNIYYSIYFGKILFEVWKGELYTAFCIDLDNMEIALSIYRGHFSGKLRDSESLNFCWDSFQSKWGLMKGTAWGRRRVGLLRLTVWENGYLIGDLGFFICFFKPVGMGLWKIKNIRRSLFICRSISWFIRRNKRQFIF